jgi:hypothetical protein
MRQRFTMRKRKPRPDANQTAAALVRKVTDTKAPRPEDLLGDPELQRQYREAKQRAKSSR